jgi:hypothetical protein
VRDGGKCSIAVRVTGFMEYFGGGHSPLGKESFGFEIIYVLAIWHTFGTPGMRSYEVTGISAS